MGKAVSWFKTRHADTPDYYGKGLAEALDFDFSDHSMDMGVNSIYIGSSNGHAAFYPASDMQLTPKNVRGESHYYDPRLRPWYSAAIGQSRETEYHGEDVGLSFHYPDYSEKVRLVRTAWKTIELEDVIYVVAIDLILYGDDIVGEFSMLGNVRAEFFQLAKTQLWNAFLQIGLPLGIPFVFFALVVVFGGFEALRDWLSIGPRLRPSISYEYRRKGEPHYWHEENNLQRTATDLVTVERKNIISRLISAVLGGSTAGFTASLRGEQLVSLTETHTQSQSQSQTINLAPTNITERCIEEWQLYEVTAELRDCRHCQQMISKNLSERVVAELIVSHRDHDYVDVRIENWGEPQQSRIQQLQVQQALARHAAVGGEAAKSFTLNNYNEKASLIPPQVAELKEIVGHLDAFEQIKGGRIGYRDGVSIGFPLYDGLAVEAVCDSWYLAQLLKMNKSEILDSGTRVSRILFVKNETEIRELFDKFGETFVELVKRSSKRLAFVRQCDLPEPFGAFTKWDFAVLEYGTEKAMIMVSDTGQSNHQDVLGNNEGVTGELSWRRADVEFYHRLFEIMYRHKRDLLELVSEWFGELVPTESKPPQLNRAEPGSQLDEIRDTEDRPSV